MGLHDHTLTLDEYNRLPLFFDPEKFDAKAWVRAGQGSGHEVHHHHFPPSRWFCEFDSKVSVGHRSATPYKKDPLKMLRRSATARESNSSFTTAIGWHNPNYYREGRNFRKTDDQTADWTLYLDDYMDGQLRELLTYYGPMAASGSMDVGQAGCRWHLPKTYALIHQLQPAALIIPDHHQTRGRAKDVQTFERDLPGQIRRIQHDHH